MGTLKVLVVDDNATFLRAATLLLSATPGVNVVGSACTGASALLTAKLRAPDLILMDVNMPGMDGLTAVTRMREAGVAARIVLMSLDASFEAQARALGIDLDGFIAKSEFAVGVKQLLGRLMAPRDLCGEAR